jgi:L-serine kinase (ADP)
MFSIKTGELSMHLEVVPVRSLRPHETTLPHIAEALALQFKDWARLQNPIIVESNNIVLDGNHRATVFRRLGFRYIPVCRIDYYSDQVGLRYWFRIVTGVRTMDWVRQTALDMGASLEPAPDRPALAARLRADPLLTGLEHAGSRFVLGFPPGVVFDGVSAYEALERVQERLIRAGAALEYVPCQALAGPGCLEGLSEDTLVIWTPHITKDMVVEAAGCGKVFTPKATRHLVPARPVNVNVPIRWFREDVSQEEMNERFTAFLQGKKLRRFGPGQVINGRYYGEDVFVFYDRKPEIKHST